MMTDTPAAKQRLRITFTRDERLKYIGHLDMARTWQRIVAARQLPLAYSEGFNPQPRMSFAAALPVGCTSDHEELDLVLSPPCAIDEVKAQLDRALPPGMKLISIEEMPLNAPALQMQLAAAEFEITVAGEETIGPLHERVAQFNAAAEVHARSARQGVQSAPVGAGAVDRAGSRPVCRAGARWASRSGRSHPIALAGHARKAPAGPTSWRRPWGSIRRRSKSNARNCCFLTKRIETV